MVSEAAVSSSSTSEKCCNNNNNDIKNMVESKLAMLQLKGESMSKPVDIPSEMLSNDLVKSLQEEWKSACFGEDASQVSLQVQAAMEKHWNIITKLQTKFNEAHSKHVLVKQSFDALNSKHTKTLDVKLKLEELCRGLQSQNKLITAESEKMVRSSNDKRDELSVQFKGSIDDISTKMDAQNKEMIVISEENDSLREHLKNLLAQIETRDAHFAKQLEAKNLEIQLSEAKLNAQVAASTEEAAKTELVMKSAAENLERENALRSQLDEYATKFESIQESIAKNNDVFESFKQERKDTTKLISLLRKENSDLSAKCKKYDQGALKSVFDTQQLESALSVEKKKNESLEKLCRTLQESRKKD